MPQWAIPPNFGRLANGRSNVASPQCTFFLLCAKKRMEGKRIVESAAVNENLIH